MHQDAFGTGIWYWYGSNMHTDAIYATVVGCAKMHSVLVPVKYAHIWNICNRGRMHQDTFGTGIRYWYGSSMHTDAIDATKVYTERCTERCNRSMYRYVLTRTNIQYAKRCTDCASFVHNLLFFIENHVKLHLFGCIFVHLCAYVHTFVHTSVHLKASLCIPALISMLHWTIKVRTIN